MNPADLRYAKTHEWIQMPQGGSPAVIGLSKFAVEALTDLVYIELPEVGRQVAAGESIAEIESVKAVSDIYAPIAGEIVEVNEALATATDDRPEPLEALSSDPYGAGWIAKIKPAGDAENAELLDYDDYQRLCEEEEH